MGGWTEVTRIGLMATMTGPHRALSSFHQMPLSPNPLQPGEGPEAGFVGSSHVSSAQLSNQAGALSGDMP